MAVTWGNGRKEQLGPLKTAAAAEEQIKAQLAAWHEGQKIFRYYRLSRPACAAIHGLRVGLRRVFGEAISRDEAAVSQLSHARQCGEEVFRMLVAGYPPARGGGGLPQRMVVSSLHTRQPRIDAYQVATARRPAKHPDLKGGTPALAAKA